MTTRLKATPKISPLIKLATGLVPNCPPTVKASKIPKPMYIPAKIESTT
ncbi:Protein of unknown function [Lactobacillus delbrueckii subsp. lactis]|jgi:hypothetical protein|nr:Protein of unknown function [Lactobacillus delbrueckii subsp. lactis]